MSTINQLIQPNNNNSIQGTNIYNSIGLLSSDIIPDSNNTRSLGSSTSGFKSLYVDSGIYLTLASGANISPFQYYEQYSMNITLTCRGSATPISILLNITRIGQTCYLNVPSFTLTSGALTSAENAILSTNSIPARFLPGTLEIIGYCRIQVQGSPPTFGFVMLNNYGILQLYQDAAIDNFPVTTAITLLQPSNCCWTIGV